jgi:hypothetical protein
MRIVPAFIADLASAISGTFRPSYSEWRKRERAKLERKLRHDDQRPLEARAHVWHGRPIARQDWNL